jgi:dihydroxy-acid dehydratase
VAFRCGEVILTPCATTSCPRDIATRKAFENAIAGVAATGGSTNAVLHLLAMAREAEVPLDIDDFQPSASARRIFVDLKPSGRYVAWTSIRRAASA